MRRLLICVLAALQLAAASADKAREAHNLKVFDAAIAELKARYYDQSFGGQDLDALRREFRPRAAAAKNDLDLYINVLTQVTARLPASHTTVLPPIQRGVFADAPNGPKCEAVSMDLGLVTGRPWAKGAVARVAMVAKGSAAERAGVEPGTPIHSWGIQRASCSRSRVTLKIRAADGALREVAYDVPAAKPAPSHAARALPSGLRLLRFDAFEPAEVAWATAELAKAPAAGVILDLRTNPGGRVSVAEEFAGLLLGPDRPMGVMRGAKGARPLKSRGRTTYAGPVAVLVGPASASAAEITADVLRHHGRAVLVGERTGGSVLVSRTYGLPGGGQVQIATSDFVTPAGGRLEDVGVTPDLFARETLAAIRADRDLVVEAAEKALLERAAAARAGSTPPSS